MEAKELPWKWSRSLHSNKQNYRSLNGICFSHTNPPLWSTKTLSCTEFKPFNMYLWFLKSDHFGIIYNHFHCTLSITMIYVFNIFVSNPAFFIETLCSYKKVDTNKICRLTLLLLSMDIMGIPCFFCSLLVKLHTFLPRSFIQCISVFVLKGNISDSGNMLIWSFIIYQTKNNTLPLPHLFS